MSKLVNFGIALALIMGGGGGALAAAVCTHADCAAGVGASGRNDSDHTSHDAHHAPSSDAAKGHYGDEANAVEHTTDEHEIQPSFLDPHDGSCGHCVGRSSSLPAPEKERRSYAPKREDRVLIVASVKRLASPSAGFVREVTPHQGAPPGRASRHVLNSVFRI